MRKDILKLRLGRLVLLAEAAMSLMIARAVLKMIPFRYLEPWFRRSISGNELGEEERTRTCGLVGDAIETVRSRLPIPATCFSVAIATQTMLRRRQVSTFLHIGASGRGQMGSLTAHVWLTDSSGNLANRHLRRLGFPCIATYGPSIEAPSGFSSPSLA
jgi:hypothetical protein